MLLFLFFQSDWYDWIPPYKLEYERDWNTDSLSPKEREALSHTYFHLYVSVCEGRISFKVWL